MMADSVYAAIEEAARESYIRALKRYPPDLKESLLRARAVETSPVGRGVLDTMLRSIEVAERDDNLVCQDTGTVIYFLEIGRHTRLDLRSVEDHVRRGTERATVEHPLRPNAVHPLTRTNTFTNTGHHLPVLHWQFVEGNAITLHCLPKGSGSENNSYLKMLTPADGVRGIKRFVLECIVQSGAKPCPPTIVGVGLGGTSDLAMTLAKRAAALRPIGSRNPDPAVAELESELTETANQLGIGPMGLGGRATVFCVNIEHAHTHITQNPVAVNHQCWAARRCSATVTPEGRITYGF